MGDAGESMQVYMNKSRESVLSQIGVFKLRDHHFGRWNHHEFLRGRCVVNGRGHPVVRASRGQRMIQRPHAAPWSSPALLGRRFPPRFSDSINPLDFPEVVAGVRTSMAARVAASKTSSTPSLRRDEHSLYDRAPISDAT